MKFLKLFAFVLLGFSSLAFGNAKVIGNGGKIVVCSDVQRPEHMQLVDLYEAQLLRGWTAKVPSGAKDPVALAGLVIERIKTVNPTRYERYRGFLSTFLSEARFVSGQELVDIPDSDHPAYPENCKVQQAAIQRSPLTTNDPRYVINNDLWMKMDLTNRAALVLHEVIYREQILVDVNTSATTRFINSALWADVIDGMDQVQYYNFMKDFIPDVDFEDFNFAICRPGYKEGTLNQCERREGISLFKKNEEWLVRGFVLPSWSPLAQGKIQYFNLVDPKTNITTRFIVYGPYSKHENSLVIPHGADWLTQIGANSITYQDYKVIFHGNLLPTSHDDYKWFPRKKECFEIWECQPPGLDFSLDQNQKPMRTWSTLTTTRDRRLLNFHVGSMTTPNGHAITICRDLVNLHEDGSISRCTGDGSYQDKDVKLVFDKTFFGFDQQGRIEFAQEMKSSQAYFQKKWIPISSADWYGRGYYFHSFSTTKDLLVQVDDQQVEMPAVNINLNSKGEVISFGVLKNKAVKMKYGSETLLVKSWYLAGADPTGEPYPLDPAPAGSRIVHLAEAKKMKNSQGIAHTYQPGWYVYIDKNGVVISCKTSGGRCE